MPTATDGTSNRGEAHGNAKLTADDVREIRRLYAGGGWSYVRLGERYGVRHVTAHRAVTGETWAHVD